MTSPLEWCIALPFAGGALAFLAGRRIGVAIGIIAGTGTVLAVMGVVHEVWTRGPVRYSIGGWGAPLGIDLLADGLSAVMLLMTALVGWLSSLYARGYFGVSSTPDGWTEREGFFPLWLLLWGSLNALFLSADIFNLYVTLELLGLAAIALLVLARETVALVAAVRYLMAALVGSLAYLLGVVLLYGAFDTLDIALLGERVVAGPAVWAALTLMSVGLALKTALFPLHFWLPLAHASAPAPVSAALSGLVVKASFYLLLRLWFVVFPEVMTFGASQLIGLLGAMAIVWGSLQAYRQDRLKLLIAHSTVAQIGYLFLLVPLALPHGNDAAWRHVAWSGGVFHALSHALAKAAMFLAAGNLMKLTGTDKLRAMRGMATIAPATLFAFGLAGINLLGLPPSGGFVSKWLLLEAAAASGQWWWAAVILGGGLLAAAYVFRVLNCALTPAGDGDAPHATLPAAMVTVPLALAVVSLLLGLRATEVLLLLRAGSPILVPPVGP